MSVSLADPDGSRSRPAAGSHTLLRLAIYSLDFPESWRAFPVGVRPTLGRYRSDDPRTIANQLRALAYARVDVGLVPWSSRTRTRLPLVLDAARSGRSSLRFAVALPPALANPSGLGGKIAAVAVLGRSPWYLRLDGRPAIAVLTRGPVGCRLARRLAAAAPHDTVLVQTGSVPRRCVAPVRWLARNGVLGTDAYTVRANPVAGIQAWSTAVAAMVRSGARLELVDSFNDWGSGTAVESDASRESSSGFGLLVDVLHANGAGARHPTVSGVGVSAVTATTAVVFATVSGGIEPGTWHVEFGTTSSYGMTTSDQPIAARAPATSSAVTLGELPPNSELHARVVVSDAGVQVASTDIVFRTGTAPTVEVAAVGDIACDSADPSFNGGAGVGNACHERAVSDAIMVANPAAVLALGDIQCETGTLAAYAASYAPTWGRFVSITHPAIGNHEYLTSGASGYFQFFGAAAGDPSRGYYSFDLGGWHILSLNSNCAKVGGCQAGSAQERWVAADLAAHPTRCALAYFHHPRFSSFLRGLTPGFPKLSASVASWSSMATTSSKTAGEDEGGGDDVRRDDDRRRLETPIDRPLPSHVCESQQANAADRVERTGEKAIHRVHQKLRRNRQASSARADLQPRQHPTCHGVIGRITSGSSHACGRDEHRRTRSRRASEIDEDVATSTSGVRARRAHDDEPG